VSHSCAQWRGDIGAYVVGALDSRARARVSRHLVACRGCRADYDELVPVRAWLGRLAPAAPRPGPGRAPGRAWPQRASLLAAGLPEARPGGRRAMTPEPGARPPAPPATPRRRASGPRRRRALKAAAAAAATAIAFPAALAIAGPSAPGYRALDSATGVSGRAELHTTPAGTAIDLTVTGLPRRTRCVLVAVARGGADIAGTWNTAYDGSARISGTSAFPARQLSALRIESDTGTLLLSITVPP
jgi:hypothetical protein